MSSRSNLWKKLRGSCLNFSGSDSKARHDMNTPKPALFVGAESSPFCYTEKSNPATSNLEFLTYGVYEMTGPVCSAPFTHTSEEPLLFFCKG